MRAMKQQSLKHRMILQLADSKIVWSSKFFIQPEEKKSLKTRVQVLPKRKGY